MSPQPIAGAVPKSRPTRRPREQPGERGDDEPGQQPRQDVEAAHRVGVILPFGRGSCGRPPAERYGRRRRHTGRRWQAPRAVRPVDARPCRPGRPLLISDHGFQTPRPASARAGPAAPRAPSVLDRALVRQSPAAADAAAAEQAPAAPRLHAGHDPRARRTCCRRRSRRRCATSARTRPTRRPSTSSSGCTSARRSRACTSAAQDVGASEPPDHRLRLVRGLARRGSRRKRAATGRRASCTPTSG